MAFAPTSPPTRNADPETERLVQDLVSETVVRRMVSVGLLLLTVGRAAKKGLPVLA